MFCLRFSKIQNLKAAESLENFLTEQTFDAPRKLRK